MKNPLQVHSRRGLALILTLFMVVLLTFMTVAFLSRTVSNQQIEASSVGGAQAEVLARSAANIILSDLKSEIIAGSQVIASGTQAPTYKPLTAKNVRPSIARSASIPVTNPVYSNLIKQSFGRFFPSSADYANATPIILSDTGLTTDVPSLNGTTVVHKRWDDPVSTTSPGGPMLLIGNIGFSRFGNLAYMPRWILMSRLGVPAKQNWNAAFKNYALDNSEAVTGRFAFNVYDEGGLLDVNVAGFPTGLPDRAVSQKGTLALAQLSAIPGIDTDANANLFVGNWRNLASGSSPNNYLAYLGFPKNGASDLTTNTYFNLGPKSGFQRLAVGASGADNRIMSRQDLIRLAVKSAPGYGITAASLPYLTHFSRDLNSPSWLPATPTGSSIDYAAAADDPASANRNLPNVRVLAPFTRANGVMAVEGEALVQSRFPLSRLSSLASGGVETSALVMLNGKLQKATAATVQRDFGLVWNASARVWKYVGATGSTEQTEIKTLAQVAAQNREPNFFELLKVSILAGSLGKSGGNTLAKNSAEDLSRDNQILQIGANIIDQYDADNYPTGIAYQSVVFNGIENLPYISELFPKTYWAGFNKDDVTTNKLPVQPYLAVELWNPHQPDVLSLPGPTKIRFTTSQSALMRIRLARGKMDSTQQVHYPDGLAYKPIPGYKAGGAVNLALDADITSSSYREPKMMNSATGDPGYQPAVKAGALVLPPVETSPPAPAEFFDGTTKVVWAPHEYQSTVFMLQYEDASGKYRTYSTYAGFEQKDTSMGNFGNYMDVSKTEGWEGNQYSKSDPRTGRFGYSFGWLNGVPGGVNTSFGNQSWSPTGTLADHKGIAQSKPNFASGYVSDTPFCPLGQMITNKFSGLTYADVDGVIRPADHNLDGAAGVSNSPFVVGDAANARPVILNRAFRSVGELGYVFRDQPWKTIDLMSAQSADTGLLDIFSVDETAELPIGNVTAGRVDLNTRLKPVLQAVLAGAGRNEAVAPTKIGLAEAGLLADEIIAQSTGPNGPFTGRADFVRRLGNTTVDTAHPAVKTQREAMVRALADVSTTRTWTLLIDVIAQSGRYPATATKLEQFIVEGEKRYWLHVAIDRYTGKVIDQQLEAVFE